jgi:predicted nucleic acid-binding protein
MVAASDTSPISSLALIDRLDLLPCEFDNVCIPDAVRAELDRIPCAAAKTAIERGMQAGWLRLRPVRNARLAAALASDLDSGEAEAIILATEIQADYLLIDEKKGRVFARQAGLAVTGVLGILLRAKAMGRLSSIKAEVEALRDRAGFFIAPALEQEVLRSAKE